jgi:hypothetical protein
MTDEKENNVISISGESFSGSDSEAQEPCESLIEILEDLTAKAKRGELREIAFVTRYGDYEISRGYTGKGLSGLMAGIIWQLAMEYRDAFDTACMIEEGFIEE